MEPSSRSPRTPCRSLQVAGTVTGVRTDPGRTVGIGALFELPSERLEDLSIEDVALIDATPGLKLTNAYVSNRAGLCVGATSKLPELDGRCDFEPLEGWRASNKVLDQESFGLLMGLRTLGAGPFTYAGLLLTYSMHGEQFTLAIPQAGYVCTPTRDKEGICGHNHRATSRPTRQLLESARELADGQPVNDLRLTHLSAGL